LQRCPARIGSGTPRVINGGRSIACRILALIDIVQLKRFSNRSHVTFSLCITPTLLRTVKRHDSYRRKDAYNNYDNQELNDCKPSQILPTLKCSIHCA
jgi:hypothetical protein